MVIIGQFSNFRVENSTRPLTVDYDAFLVLFHEKSFENQNDQDELKSKMQVWEINAIH